MAKDNVTWIAVLREAAKDGSVPEDEPRFYGYGFARDVPALDAMAGRAGVPPLSGFYFDDSVFDDESADEILTDRHGTGASQEDMDEDTFESLPDLIRVYRSWKGPFFPPAAALESVRGIKRWAAANPAEADGLLPGVLEEGTWLDQIEEVLDRANKAGRDFRFAPPGPA